MKKILILFMCALTFFCSAIPCMAAGAIEDFENEIGEIACPRGTPVIDGTINVNEGWSSVQPIDKTNTDGAWGGEDVTISGELYRAYDDTNFYIAAKIDITEFSLCEGEDWIEGNDTGDLPGWDGDVFILSMDPLKSLLAEGFANDPAAWYCFGLFEGNVVRTYRTHINTGEISDIVKAAGAPTSTGWLFEAAIPWETICKDLDDVSFGYVTLTPEDIIKDGNIISAAMIYYDRRFDPEAGQRITYSRYVTIANVLPDGTPGVLATPWKIGAHGIFLRIEDSTEEVSTEQETQAQTSAPTQSSTTAKPSVTNKQNVSSSTGTASAQTFDIAVAAALGALTVSGIGIAASKKKKQ